MTKKLIVSISRQIVCREVGGIIEKVGIFVWFLRLRGDLRRTRNDGGISSSEMREDTSECTDSGAPEMRPGGDN